MWKSVHELRGMARDALLGQSLAERESPLCLPPHHFVMKVRCKARVSEYMCVYVGLATKVWKAYPQRRSCRNWADASCIVFRKPQNRQLLCGETLML